MNWSAYSRFVGDVFGAPLAMEGLAAFFIDSKVRTPEWVYQKVADARIDVPTTHMTINLTNGLMSEQEICEIVSYIISAK